MWKCTSNRRCTKRMRGPRSNTYQWQRFSSQPPTQHLESTATVEVMFSYFVAEKTWQRPSLTTSVAWACVCSRTVPLQNVCWQKRLSFGNIVTRARSQKTALIRAGKRAKRTRFLTCMTICSLQHHSSEILWDKWKCTEETAWESRISSLALIDPTSTTNLRRCSRPEQNVRFIFWDVWEETEMFDN